MSDPTNAPLVNQPETVDAEADVAQFEKPRAGLMRIGQDALFQIRDPKAALTEIRRAATALTEYMTTKQSKVVLNGKRFLECDDWQAIGTFYGATALLEADQYVNYGAASGFEATYVVKTRDGRVIGRASSMCLNDEDHWKSRPSYRRDIQLKDGTWVSEDDGTADKQKANWKWEKKPGWAKARPVARRMKGPDVSVPLFQLRSMAQTRAESRALAAVFRFVPNLLGISGTPAEELPNAVRESADGRDREPAWQPPEAVDGDVVDPETGEVVGTTAAPPTATTAAPTEKVTKLQPKDATATPAAPPKKTAAAKGKAKPAATTASADVPDVPKGSALILAVGDREVRKATGGKPYSFWPVTFADEKGERTAYAWTEGEVPDIKIVRELRAAMAAAMPMTLELESKETKQGTRLYIADASPAM